MIKPITSVKLSGRRVILRAGFDVPLKLNANGEAEVADDVRIRDIKPTLDYLIGQKAKIIIISHLNRPNGWETEKSLLPVARRLAVLLNRGFFSVSRNLPENSGDAVCFVPTDITREKMSRLSTELVPGGILVLENLRFYPGERDNDPEFAKLLAEYGEVFVNEAFSDAHRADASVVGLPELLSSYAGISFVKEVQSLDRVLKKPAQPMVVIMGGAKIAGKIDMIKSLAGLTSHFLLGGALANAFLKAAGYEIGKSKTGEVQLARELLRNYKNKLVLPVDVVVMEEGSRPPTSVLVEKTKSTQSIVDIGPETVRLFADYIRQAQTLVWNGPMGLIETKPFDFGSLSIARLLASRARGKAYGVVGGGETVEMVNLAKTAEFMDHVSTGGGAMLEFLGGKVLPGIKALEK